MTNRTRITSGLLRAWSIIVLAMGLVLLLAGGWAITRAGAIAENLSSDTPIGFDPIHWAGEWKKWSLGLGILGVAMLAGAIATLLKRAWGFLLVAVGLILALALAWILQSGQPVVYPFQRATLTEVGVLIGIAALSGYAFVKSAPIWRR